MLSVGTIVIGVEDLHRAVAFWTKALTYVPKREIKADDDFMILVPAVGHGAHLALDVSETPVQRIPVFISISSRVTRPTRPPRSSDSSRSGRLASIGIATPRIPTSSS